MPKPGGGGGGSNIFISSITGPPPGPNTTGADTWITLGTIPSGKAIWLGNGQFTSPDKSIAFEVRTNNSGQSSASEVATTLLASTSVAPRNGTVFADYYRKGRLHITTVVGAGAEKWYLRLKAKSGSQGSYLFSINYTEE